MEDDTSRLACYYGIRSCVQRIYALLSRIPECETWEHIVTYKGDIERVLVFWNTGKPDRGDTVLTWQFRMAIGA